MKNLINYYYNLNIDNIHQKDNIYYFSYLNNSYMFKEYSLDIRNIESICNLNMELNNYYHRIIRNKDNYCYTVINNKNYVLLRLSNIIDDKISIYDINNIYVHDINKYKELIIYNWIDLWKYKIDYFENLIIHVENNEFSFMPLYYFFIGLGENAISYIYDTLEEYKDYKYNNLVVSHRRLSCTNSVIEFYDPLEIVIDNRVRDLSEYIKSMFFNNDIDYDLLDEYLSGVGYDNYLFSMLMGRILFPSFFFDRYEDKNYLLKFSIDKYVMFLEEIFYIIKKKSNIREINWLKKKM